MDKIEPSGKNTPFLFVVPAAEQRSALALSYHIPAIINKLLIKNTNMQRHWLIIFLSILLLVQAKAVLAQPEWPKTITAGDGTIIDIYKPQTESFAGNILKARNAISIQEPGAQEPIFGVYWSTSTVITDRDTREVNIESVKVDHVRIPADSSKTETGLVRTALETFIPKVISRESLDEVLASLDEDKEETSLSADLNNHPPRLIFRSQPSILVRIDGKPIVKKSDRLGYPVVVNTPFTIVQFKDGKFYLYGGGHWYSAPTATGPYAYTDDKVRHPLKKIARKLRKAAQRNNDMPNTETPDNQVYDIVVTTVPAELIQTNGNPDLVPIQATALLYVQNSDNDIFVDTHTQQYYVLLSGRWYTARALDENNAWSYVPSDALPPDFAKIPEGSPKDNVLANVAGTQAAREAVRDAEVPQTAKIDRRTATTQVQYDGAPQFKPIPGTDMQYAVNTSSTVIQEDGSYYSVDNGIWFVAADPAGPWSVSNHRPAQVDRIPPNSPVYNAKYVYIYESTPDYAYMGYTPGYLNSYVDGPTVVYGTGYDYDPWIGDYFYPRPWTWGFDMDYNPWTGWGFGLGYDYDWFNDGFGLGWGMGYYGGWGGWNGGGWWGAAGAYRPAYRSWHGGRFGDRRGGYYGDRVHIDGNTHMHMRYNNNVYRGRAGVIARPRTAPGAFAGQGGFRAGYNPVFSDREGNIYRRNAQGEWQQRANRQWAPMGNRPMVRQNLERQQYMGQRAQVRMQNFQRATNFGASRVGGMRFGGGGGHFSGGGRR
jgi:hypothetical protein